MASKKSGSSEHAIPRAGVSWRTNPLTGGGSKCVVEMRPPHSKWKLHFGSYDTEFEAMFARDYAALLRDSAGEDATTAGGFNHHSNLCEFDESHVLFKSTDVFTDRCAEYKRLLEENRKENCANSPFKEFCKEARKDIINAIEEFRRRYPHKLQPAAKDLPKLDGGTHFTPPSSSFQGESSESSLMPENKQFVHESHKENFPSGSGTFNPFLSPKSCHVIRGFHGDSMFGGQSQENSPRMKENSTYKVKDSKSLLQVQLANGGNSVEPCHEPGLKMQDGDGTVPGFNSSSYNSQPTSFKSAVTSNCDQSTSITYSGVPCSSLSAGTSVEDEFCLSSYNRNSFCQEMTLIEESFAGEEGDIWLNETEIEEHFAEGEADQLQLDLSSHVDIAGHDGNGAGDFLKNDIYIYELLHGAIEDQMQMDIDETDVPIYCHRTISHKEALLAARLETQNTMLKIAQAQLEISVQQKNKLKIANLRMAKDDGVISNEDYIQQVKALLDL